LSRTGEEVYAPSDDTALLIKALSSQSGGRFLEIGFGSGAILHSLLPRFSLVVGTDVLPKDRAPRDLGSAELVLSDGAGCFREETFDVVAFNPPYLPSEGILDRTVDGGRGGVEVPLRFLEDALRVLRDGGRIFVLLSDLGDLKTFLSRCETLNVRVREVQRVRLFFESLVVYEIRRADDLL
jgi:release factor glutamine methyltransferase